MTALMLIAVGAVAVGVASVLADGPSIGPDSCCARDRLEFRTRTTEARECGRLNDARGRSVPLRCGHLYLGGGDVALDLPWAVPDETVLTFDLGRCDPRSGTFTLAATRVDDTGSNRTCTAAGDPNPEYPGRPGCLFGPPAPRPSRTSPETSTCTVLRATTSASGSGRCADGTLHGNIGLAADSYVTGDLLDGRAADRPARPGIQPCPICDPGSRRCEGGPRHGAPCTPGDSPALGDAYPTSHDCPPPEWDLAATVPITLELTTSTAARSAAASSVGDYAFCGFCGQRLSASFEGACVGGRRDGRLCASQAGCPGGVCTPKPCARDADCTTSPFTSCRQRTPGAFGVRSARAITLDGSPAGTTLADGEWHASTLVGTYCLPPTFNPTVGAVADLPGPAAVAFSGVVRLRKREGGAP